MVATDIAPLEIPSEEIMVSLFRSVLGHSFRHTLRYSSRILGSRFQTLKTVSTTENAGVRELAVLS